MVTERQRRRGRGVSGNGEAEEGVEQWYVMWCALWGWIIKTSTTPNWRWGAPGHLVAPDSPAVQPQTHACYPCPACSPWHPRYT